MKARFRIVSALLLWPGTLAAQTSGLAARVELTVSYVRSRSVESGVAQRFDGAVPGGRAELSWGRVRVEGGYAEAMLDGAGTAGRNFVDARLVAGAALVPGVAVLGGVRAHALTDVRDATRRWLFWTAGIRLETPRFARGLLAVTGDFWLALARANGVDERSFGRGMETALTGWHPSMPVFARLGYRLDEGRLEDTALRTTVEQLTLGVGYVF